MGEMKNIQTTQLEGKMLIGANWVDACDGRRISAQNPANRQVIGTFPRGVAEDVNAAALAAERAFDSWSKTDPGERTKMLLQIAERIDQRREEIARLTAIETGNALRVQTRGEAIMAVEAFRYNAGLVREIKGETIPLGEGVLSYTRREPIGVVGAIIPWNTPIALAAIKISTALAAGNTIVLKPAEDASLCVQPIVEACHEFLPPGVVNVVTGFGHEAGAALAEHPAVRKITFTGSTGVGRQIMRAASERIALVSLELGGKSPSIVFPDVDEDWAVQGVVASMRFTRQSQSCTAGSRLFLHEKIYESFLDKLVREIKKFNIGDPIDEQTDIGTLINEKQFARVNEFIDEGMSREGARLVVGGKIPADSPLSNGYYALPTVFSNVDNQWRIAREEIFGPILSVIPWNDENEVVRMANDTHYGLAGYVWTHDISRAIRMANAIEAGWVQINRGGGQSFGQSYGGFKQSGVGKELSLESLLNSFTRVKAITVGLA